MKTSATNRRLRTLLTAVSSGKLIPRPDFQRRLVWTQTDKNAFIKTVIEGYPFPEIYIAAGELDSETGEATELLVDGQQRITTLHQYFRHTPGLKLDPEVTPYHDLAPSAKEDFLEYEVVVRDLGRLPIDQVKTIFERINSANYALNSMEIHNARYSGSFKQFAEKLVEGDFFTRHGIFTAAEVRRMQDLRFGLTLCATLLSTYFNRDEEIEQFLEENNDEFPEAKQLNDEINEILVRIDSMGFSRDCRVWKRADLFTLVVELHRVLFKNRFQIDNELVSVRLKNFYQRVDQAGAEGVDLSKDVFIYYRATLQASNDRTSRLRRGEVLQAVINPDYVPEQELLFELGS